MRTLAAITLLFLGACKGDDTDETDVIVDTDDTDVEATLYDQLGGEAGVTTVVTSFIGNVAADDEINWMFANSDLDRLNDQLVAQICNATGGGCAFTGDMATIHANMAITESQWNALVGDLLEALDQNGVEYTSPNFDGGLPADQLIIALAGMHDDIVTDADGSGVLFNQLGGHAAIQAVIDDFITNVGGDDRINCFFAETDLAALNALLVEQVCAATGGYCTYSGGSMADVHAGMGITEGDWNALVGDLVLAMNANGATTSEGFDSGSPGDTLVLALAGMHDDIVENPQNNANTCAQQ